MKVESTDLLLDRLARSKGQYGRIPERRAVGWLFLGPVDPEYEHFQ